MLKFNGREDGSAKDTLIDPKDVYSLTIGEMTYYSIMTMSKELSIGERIGYAEQESGPIGLYKMRFAWEGYSTGTWYAMAGEGMGGPVSFQSGSFMNINKGVRKQLVDLCPDMVAKAEKKEYSKKTDESILEFFNDYLKCRSGK